MKIKSDRTKLCRGECGTRGGRKGLISGKDIRGRMVRDVENFDRMGWESQNDENSRGENH